MTSNPKTTGIVFAGIAPHPPLLVPAVGGSDIDQVTDSQSALREFSRRLVATNPDTVIVVSPHAPLNDTVFLGYSIPELSGDFRDFGAPKVRLAFPNDLVLLEAIGQNAIAEEVGFKRLTRRPRLEYGALVPLYYLHQAGWQGPIVVTGITNQSNDKHLAFGRALASAAYAANRRVALVASGDLSHRLTKEGRYKYEPTAHLFDEQIVEAITRGDVAGILDIDVKLKERAWEDGHRPIVIAFGAAGGMPNHQVLSYEGPFGVGYMVAVLLDTSSA